MADDGRHGDRMEAHVALGDVELAWQESRGHQATRVTYRHKDIDSIKEIG